MLTKPEWMDKKFFVNVIRHHTNDVKATVEEFKVEAGSGRGENFASEMFRVFIFFTSIASNREVNTISVIVKVKPIESFDIDTERMFMTEMKMYSQTLIDINRLLVKVTDDVELKLFPRLIYHSIEHGAIVLEDLSEKGFQTLQIPDNFDTTKLIFNRLAMYHAISFYMIEVEQADFSEYNYSVYHMPDSIQEAFFRHNLTIFKRLLKNGEWNKLNKPEYIDRIDQMIKECTSRGRRVCTPTQGGFNVLNHGDFFMRNLLFRRKNEKLSEICFLDFQLPVLASPAVDILQALYGSTTMENRKLYRNELILYYHETFVSTLKKLNYTKTPPSFNNLQTELVKNGYLGAQVCICYLPYLLSEWNKVDNKVMYVVNADTEHSKMILYKNKMFAETLNNEFEDFFLSGFI